MSQAAASAGLQPPPNEGDADGVNVGVFVGAEVAAVGIKVVIGLSVGA